MRSPEKQANRHCSDDYDYKLGYEVLLVYRFDLEDVTAIVDHTPKEKNRCSDGDENSSDEE
jgi:hypothetical protein